jgi:hypothetical protein
MNFDDAFQRKAFLEPLDERRRTNRIARDAEIGEAVAQIEAYAKGGVAGEALEEVSQVHGAGRVGRKWGRFDEKEASLHLTLEMEGPQTCGRQSLLREMGRGIEAKCEPLHRLLGTLVNHPGGSKGFHVGSGPPLLFPVSRIGGEVCLRVPKTIPVVDKGNPFRNRSPCLFEVACSSSEQLEILNRGAVRKAFEKIRERRRVEICRETGPWTGRSAGLIDRRDQGEGGSRKMGQG